MARVDSWIWGIRIAKTRSAATALCKAGHVRVNDERAKPAQKLKVGDAVRVRTPHTERIVVVRQLIERRVSAPLAAAAYEDHTPPPPPKPEREIPVLRDRGAGRPTKRDRRDIERLRGY